MAKYQHSTLNTFAVTIDSMYTLFKPKFGDTPHKISPLSNLVAAAIYLCVFSINHVGNKYKQSCQAGTKDLDFLILAHMLHGCDM